MSYTEDAVPDPEPKEMRSAVRQVVVGPEEAGQRLDNFVQRCLGGIPRSRVYRVIRKGEVRVNGHRAGPETRLKEQDRIRIPPVRLEAEGQAPQRAGPDAGLKQRISQAIVHEDRDLLVLDKPAGLAVHGGSGISFGVIEALRALRPEETLELVHRLDRDTSGCLVVARRPSVLRELHALMREGGFEKRYLALVRGRWELGHKRIDVPLRTDLRVGGERTVRAHASGKPSISEFRPVQALGSQASLVEVTLHTGRTHQIRVHAGYAGHPVAGDDKYGDAAFNESLRTLGLHRMFLHAHSVSFPLGGREFSVSTPLPQDLKAVIDALAHLPRKGTRPRSRLRGGARREGGGRD